MKITSFVLGILTVILVTLVIVGVFKINKQEETNQMKKYWNNFLNWLIPNRRKRLLSKMVRQNQELGLYDKIVKEEK